MNTTPFWGPVFDQLTDEHPEIAAVIRAAYDPVMPAVAQDAAHALRLSARIGHLQ